MTAVAIASTSLCACGCAQVTSIAPCNDRRRGWVKGEPLRFADGHKMPNQPTQDLILERVIQTDETGCWEWQGTRVDAGYGQISVRDVRHLAHRLSYEIFVGPIPDGLQIDHLCFNRPCVNPGHLEPVTAAVNSQRRTDRARTLRLCGSCGGPIDPVTSECRCS